MGAGWCVAVDGSIGANCPYFRNESLFCGVSPSEVFLQPDLATIVPQVEPFLDL